MSDRTPRSAARYTRRTVREVWAWVLLAGLASGAASAGEQDAFVRGHARFDYVPRWIQGTDTGDQDLYVSTAVDWGRSSDRWSGSVHWRGVADLDGSTGAISSRFHSVYDEYDDGVFSQLLHAYVDYRREGLLRQVRVGRQRTYRGLSLLFDGIRAQTSTGRRGARASAFAGVPVHFFEDSPAGDWVAGLELGMKPWRGGDLTALWVGVADENDYLGVPASSETNHMLVIGAGSRLAGWGQAHLRYTAVDGETKDALARLRASARKADTSVVVTYFQQSATLDQIAIDLADFGLVQGTSYPYARLHVDVAKGLKLRNDWRMQLGGSWIRRSLSDAADEGAYNREYDVGKLLIGLEAPEKRQFSASLGPVWWVSGDKRTVAVDAEVKWRRRDSLSFAFGTSYSYYQYDLQTLTERTDVTETSLRARWDANDRVRFEYRHALETFEGETIHKVKLGCTVRW